jgi:hypothetical protein
VMIQKRQSDGVLERAASKRSKLDDAGAPSSVSLKVFNDVTISERHVRDAPQTGRTSSTCGRRHSRNCVPAWALPLGLWGRAHRRRARMLRWGFGRCPTVEQVSWIRRSSGWRVATAPSTPCESSRIVDTELFLQGVRHQPCQTDRVVCHPQG